MRFVSLILLLLLLTPFVSAKTIILDQYRSNFTGFTLIADDFKYPNGSSVAGGGGGSSTFTYSDWFDQYLNTTNLVSFAGLNVTGNTNITQNLHVMQNLTIANRWLPIDADIGLSLTNGADDLILQADVGGNNYFSIETDGAFLELYANPGPANGYLMFSVSETQGAITNLNFYEGGTGHNRFWDSGSARFGGPDGYLCSELTTDVDCDTSGTGADIVIQDDVWAGGKYLSGDADWTNVTITSLQLTDDVFLRNDGDTATGDYTFDTNTFHIDSTNDRIGVGTTTPSYPLEVDGIVRATNLSLPGYISGSGILKSRLSDIIISNDLGGNAQFRLLPYLDDIYFENLYAGDMYFRTDTDTGGPSTVQMFIDGNNNRVGIGTTSPSQKLEVNGNIKLSAGDIIVDNTRRLKTFNSSGTAASIFFTNANNDIIFGDSDNVMRNFLLYQQGVPVFALTDSGIVVNDNGYAWNDFRVEGDTRQYLIFADASLDNVGIGTSSPGVTLHVRETTDTNVLRLEDSDGTCNLNPEAGGIVETCSSDEKYKTNITEVNKTEVFQYLRTWGECMREYNIIASGDKMIGPIAQCVNETLPELVTEQTNTKQNVTEYTVLVEYEGEWINETRQNITQWNETYLSVQQPDTNRLLIGAAFLYEKNQELETQLQTVRQAGIAQKQRIDALCAIAPGGTC